LRDVNIGTVLLAAFFILWLWTEFKQSAERQRILTDMEAFAAKGPRFTADDGKALEERIRKLEEKH
jgi:hypothetical protein